MSYYNPLTPIFSNGIAVQDEIEQLQASVSFSSDVEPAARTVCLWADQGISTPSPPYGPYPLTTSRGATTACGIGIDVDDNITDINSLSLIPVAANPGDATTVWIDSGTGHLMRNNVDLETTGSGDVVGPASSTADGIAVFDGTTGKLLQSSAVTVDVANDGITADYIDLTGSAFTNYALKLPSSVGSSNILVQVGTSTFIVLSPNATTSVSAGLGARNQGGNGNYGFGYEMFYNLLAAGVDNTAMGAQAMRSATTAKRCAAVGRSALYGLTTGEDNIGVGYEAGSAYTTESDNICIGNTGTAADSGVIRIGTGGTHTSAYLSGVYGTTLTSEQLATVDSDGKIGSIAKSSIVTLGEISFQDYNTPYSLALTVNVPAEAAFTSTLVTDSPAEFDSSAAGQLRYIGTQTNRYFTVTVSTSAKNAAGANQQFGFALYKNGVVVANSEYRRIVATTTDYQCCSFTKAVQLTTNDYISVFVTNYTGSNGISLGSICINATSN